MNNIARLPVRTIARRTHRARLLELVARAMDLGPGVDAVLVIYDAAGQVQALSTIGTPEATTYGQLVYALDAMAGE